MYNRIERYICIYILRLDLYTLEKRSAITYNVFIGNHAFFDFLFISFEMEKMKKSQGN